MEWVETTGRTVAEALEAALDQLGVDEHDAEVVIIEEPKSGIFGLRRSEARLRARVRPTRPRPKRQNRDRRGRGREDRGGSKRQGGEAGAQRAAGASSVGGDGEQVAVATAEGGGSAAASGTSRSRRRRGRSRGGAGSGAEASTGGEERPSGGRSSSGQSRGGRSAGGRDSQTDVEEEQMPIEEQAQLAEKFVSGVVERLGLPASTTIRVADESVIEVAVDGDELGLLIGPHGQTLGALQELTRTVVQRRGTDHGTRIMVDVAGYRAKRAAALTQFAQSVAAEVLASGTPHALEPMSAADRKVVHDAVNEIEGVSTSSEGEESGRHVVIRPDASAGSKSTAGGAAGAEADDVEAADAADEPAGTESEDAEVAESS